MQQLDEVFGSWPAAATFGAEVRSLNGGAGWHGSSVRVASSAVSHSRVPSTLAYSICDQQAKPAATIEPLFVESVVNFSSEYGPSSYRYAKCLCCTYASFLALCPLTPFPHTTCKCL